MSDLATLTIGIISCNRLHYLRALIESLRLSLGGVKAQWIVVDNASVEEGLQDYLRSLDFLDDLVLQPERHPTTEFVTAENMLVERSTGDFLLALTDDMQFIRKDNWLAETLRIASAHPQIGTILLDAQRRKRIAATFPRGLKGFLQGKKRVFQLPGQATRLFSYGNKVPGIAVSVANGMTRLSIWRQIGPIQTTRTSFSTRDTSGGAEDWMVEQYLRSGLQLESCLLDVPAALSLYTDSHGTQARIRGNRRYGKYFPPEKDFYFKMLEESEIAALRNPHRPVGYEEIARPQGFTLPLDAAGNIVKYALDEDQFEWVHPSVKGQEF